MDARDLHLEIDHPHEKHGWIHCYLTFDALTHHIYASGAMPPFHDLLDFLRSLTLQRLPAWFFWDEEGTGPYFEAWPLDEPIEQDGPDFHLRVIHETYDIHWIGEEGDEDRQKLVNSYQVLLVDADLNREAVVDVFLTALRDFVLYGMHPDEWKISLADLMAFEQLRIRQIPPRSDFTHAEPADLIITRWQDEEEANGSQNLELRMWDMRLIDWKLDDTDAFWPQWIALLEHALNNRPYEMSVIDMYILRLNRELVADSTIGPEETVPVWSTRLKAIPLDHPRHFRLQIFKTDYHYSDFLRVDEVLDAFQLASVFLKEFDNLLNEGYQPYPDEDGVFFDLRELPVGQLREIIGSKH